MLSRHRYYRGISMVGVILALTVPALMTQDLLRGWKTSGTANGMILAEVDESGESTTLSFRNSSKKVVTAFVVSYAVDPQSSTDHYVDCFHSEPSCWPPDAIYKLKESTTALSAVRERTFEVATVFEDGTSEGAQSQVDFVRFTRLGLMLEGERLKNIFSSSQHTNDVAVKGVLQEVGRLPSSPKEALDSIGHIILPGVSVDQLKSADKKSIHAFFVGVRDARESALRQLDDMSQLPPEAQTLSLSRLREDYEDLSQKHHAFCKRTLGGSRQ